MLLGVSCSYLDAVETASSYNVIQINIGPLGEPKYPPDEDLLSFPDLQIPVFIHSKLCFNISKKNLYYAIKKEMSVLKRQKYGKGIVIHLSSWYTPNRESALADVVEKLNELEIKYEARLVLESTHRLKSLGSQISDFGFIASRLKSIQFCLDTSHLFLTGYPIQRPEYLLEFFTELELEIGLERISLIHLNDINSTFFGPHTEHLNIGDGLIFKDPLVLNYFISFCKAYDVPIIFERNSFTPESIQVEINKVKEVEKDLIFPTREEFDLFLKNSLVLHFIDRLIEFYEVMDDDTSPLLKAKTNILFSFKGKGNRLIKTENGYEYTFTLPHATLFNRMMNERDYHVFDSFFNNADYLNTKELLSVTSFGPETVRSLKQKNITSLSQLKNESASSRKKLLTPFQHNVINNHKFIRFIDWETAEKVVKCIKDNYYEDNVHIYGSYFRIASGFERLRFLKDIDVLCVGSSLPFIQMLMKLFKLKVELYQGERRKSFVFSHQKNYFTLEVYTCSKEEEPFMTIYLKGPTHFVKKVYAIAKAKGYKMNNRGISKDGNPLYFENERKLLEFLNIKPLPFH